MTKKIVVMTFVTCMMTSHVTAMLVKALKNSIQKTSEQRNFCANKKIDKKKIDNLQFDRGCQFLKAIERDDVELADLLFKNFKFNLHNDWIKDVKSLDQIQLLEKYGCNIHNIDDGYGGNYLHYAIGFIDNFYSKSVDDSFIKYAVAKGVDPHATDGLNKNLWHKLLGSFYYHQCLGDKDFFLRRSKLLYSLNVDPHHKDDSGWSAIKSMQNTISYLKKEYKRASWGCYQISEQKIITSKLEICRKLLKIMNGEDFNKKSNKE